MSKFPDTCPTCGQFVSEPIQETQQPDDCTAAYNAWTEKRGVWPRVFMDEAFSAGWDARGQKRESIKAIPADQWCEEDGNVLWWRLPIEQPPYCGTPLDGAYWIEDYYTHFTRLEIPTSDIEGDK